MGFVCYSYCLVHEDHTGTFIDSANLLDGVDVCSSTEVNLLELGSLTGF